MITLTENSRKCKLINSDRKEISDWQSEDDVEQKRQSTKEFKETFRDDGCFHFLDCGNGFTGIFICQNFPNCVF